VVDSVAPVGTFDADVKPSPMSRAGSKYCTANGARITSMVQQRVVFMNDFGDRRVAAFRAAAVERPLLSASQFAASGNSVAIDKAGARIGNGKTGKTVKLVKRDGVLILRMWFLAPPGPEYVGLEKEAVQEHAANTP
jgi:hypothetical protein